MFFVPQVQGLQAQRWSALATGSGQGCARKGCIAGSGVWCGGACACQIQAYSLMLDITVFMCL
eukprot:359159-Chlamydomonas_euryale.AAC.4